MPRIRFRWILQRFVIPLLQSFIFTQCRHVISFLFRTKYSICKCMNFLLPACSCIYSIWYEFPLKIFSLSSLGGARRHGGQFSNLREDKENIPHEVRQQFIWQVFIEASCLLKMKSNYISDSHLTSLCGKMVMSLVKISINKRYMF